MRGFAAVLIMLVVIPASFAGTLYGIIRRAFLDGMDHSDFLTGIVHGSLDDLHDWLTAKADELDERHKKKEKENDNE